MASLKQEGGGGESQVTSGDPRLNAVASLKHTEGAEERERRLRARDPRLNAVASLKPGRLPQNLRGLPIVIHGLMPWPH